MSALSRPISCAPLCDMIRLIWSGRAPFWAGVLITLADLVLRLVPLDQELRLGVMVSLIGAPVFILIAARSRGMGR